MNIGDKKSSKNGKNKKKWENLDPNKKNGNINLNSNSTLSLSNGANNKASNKKEKVSNLVEIGTGVTFESSDGFISWQEVI